MKKYTAYLLLCIYLFSFSEARQFLKLPHLVEHYYTHVEKDHSTTLFSFLKMHYWDNHGQDADYKEDMKLPFKTHDSQCHSNTFNCTIPQDYFEIAFENQILFLTSKAFFGYSEFIPSQSTHSIFRPPVATYS